MEDFNEPRTEYDKNVEIDSSYRLRSGKHGKGTGEKRRWIFPIAIIFLLVAGISVFWYLGGLSSLAGLFFAQEEQYFMVRMPEALLSYSSNKEALTVAAGIEFNGEEMPDENGFLIYTVSAEAGGRLLEKAEHNLEEKIAALKGGMQYPYLVEVSYDSAYRDFSLTIEQPQGQIESARVAATELYMMAAFYQQIAAGADTVSEVKVSLVDAGSRNILEQLTYPVDLMQVAALDNAEVPVEAPATPQVGDKVIVATGPDNLNLRNGPEITYLIIDILNSGTILEVIGIEAVWLNVITPDGKEGWVHGDFVSLVDSLAPEHAPQAE